MPVRKVTVLTLADYEKFILEELGKLGAIQLRRLSGEEYIGFREETAEEERVYDQLYERLRILHGKLSEETASPGGAYEEVPPEKVEDTVKDFEDRAARLDEEIRGSRERLNELGRAKPFLKAMEELGVNPGDIGEFMHIFGTMGSVKTEALQTLERRFKQRRDIAYRAAPIPGSEGVHFLYLTGLLELKPQIEKALSAAEFEEFKPPMGIPADLGEASKWIEEEMEAEEGRLRRLDGEWTSLKRDFQSKHSALEEATRRLLALARARANMLRSEMMIVLQGWTPEDKMASLNFFLEDVKRRMDGRLAYSFEDPAPDEEVPTVMKNPRLFSAYEVLTRQYGYPDPRESDPTPISTILWVIMFGMMFPDYGQGLAILLLGMFFAYRLRRPLMGINMARVGRLMTGLGVSAIIFGFLTGSFFLIEVKPLWPGLMPAWITYPSNVIWIIKLAVFFGITQIILGMSISIRNHLKAGERLEALLSEHGLAGLVTFIGIAVVAFEFLGVSVFPGVRFPRLGLNVLTHWTMALPLMGLLAIFVRPILSGEGATMGAGVVLEAFISFLANMLSYARIAGFAIAHAAFALVVGELLHVNPLLGIGLGLIFLNMFALTLELLVCMIQALRLLYYEFSTKFFKGTGVPYIPYRL
ncbi:MAG: V-type ATPase 116kDa subunit family protein [Candidatus Bathyarchaeia archaeon]